jgi:hypothetical protein
MPMSSPFSIINGLHPRPLGLGSLIFLPLALRQDNMTTHQYSLHATACRVARLSTRSRHYDDVRGFYIRAFPTSGHPKSEVGYDYTANWALAVVGLSPTGRVLLWAAQAARCQAPFFVLEIHVNPSFGSLSSWRLPDT